MPCFPSSVRRRRCHTGLATMADLDTAVTHVLTQKFAAGLFDARAVTASPVCACLCARVCVFVRARACMCACACACVCPRAHTCVCCVCARACVRACVCACVRARACACAWFVRVVRVCVHARAQRHATSALTQSLDNLDQLDSPPHRALALEAAEQGLVLLQNVNATLPLALSGKRPRCLSPGFSSVPKSATIPRQPESVTDTVGGGPKWLFVISCVCGWRGRGRGRRFSDMVLTAQSRADQALGGEAVLSETFLPAFSMHQARTWRCSARLPMTRSHWSAATYSRARSLGSAHHSALHSIAAEAVTCSSGPQEAAPDTCVRSPGTRAPWPGMSMLMDTCHAHGALWPRAELRREGGHGEGGAGARGHEPGAREGRPQQFGLASQNRFPAIPGESGFQNTMDQLELRAVTSGFGWLRRRERHAAHGRLQ